MLQMQPDRPSPQTLRRPPAAACLATAILLAAAGHAQAGLGSLNYVESKSGNYSAEARLGSTDPVQGVVAANISFDNVPLGATLPDRSQHTLGPFFATADIVGNVTRTLNDDGYVIAPRMGGVVDSPNFDTSKPTNQLGISATYMDTFYMISEGLEFSTLGITLTTAPNQPSYPTMGTANSAKLSLVFADADDPASSITINAPFGPNTTTKQINIAFGQFGPSELFTMTMALQLNSTVRQVGNQAEPDQQLISNLTPSRMNENVPIAFIHITNPIPNLRDTKFPGVGAPTPIVPGPAAAPAGLLLLGGMALSRRRRGSAAG